MLASCFILSLSFKPLEFPEVPISKEIDAGVRTYQLGKGLDRLYLDDRKVVGTWFDGKVRREADAVVWLSPSLISRWLGYLEAKEKWDEGELENRWSRLRRDLGGRMTFIVRLCSMPKIDAFETAVDSEAVSAESREVRFLFTSSRPEKPAVVPRLDMLFWQISAPLAKRSGRRVVDGIRIEPKFCVLSDRQSHEASEVLREDWWLRVPFGEPLQPEFARQPCFDGYPLGEYYSSTYLLRMPLPDPKSLAGQFELRIFSPKKERVARFSPKMP